jgi:predicted ATPase
MQQSSLPTSILSLTPLTFQEVIRFTRSLAPANTTLTATQSETIGRWLSSETQGNPLHLMETLRTLLAHNLIELQQQADSWTVHFKNLIESAGRWMEVLPPGMFSLLRTRLKVLTPHATALLAATAISGRAMTLADLLTLTELSQRSGQGALEELLQEQFLSPETDRTYYFTHDCIRQMIWTQMSNRLRSHLHRRVLLLLQRERAAPALILHHAQAARFHEQAFHSALEAGDEAMRLSVFQDAIAFYSQAEQALNHLTGQTPDAVRLLITSIEHMYLQLARAYYYRHDNENVEAVFRSMNKRAKALQATAMQCLALNRLAAHMLHIWSDPKEAQSFLDEAQQLIAMMNNDPDRRKEIRIETALHLTQLGNLYLAQGNEHKALHAFQHAAQLAQQLADTLSDEQQHAIFPSTQGTAGEDQPSPLP